MTTETLCARFIEGLKEYGLTLADMKRFVYAGEAHLDKRGKVVISKYFLQRGFSDDDLPNYTTACICHQKIRRNCYITDDTRILVIGSCCKDKFLEPKNRGKTCERCGEPHRNLKDNRCNACREICRCGRSCNSRYGQCYTCAYGKPCENCNKPHLNKHVNRCDKCREGICDMCGYFCNPRFKICYRCHIDKKNNK